MQISIKIFLNFDDDTNPTSRDTLVPVMRIANHLRLTELNNYILSFNCIGKVMDKAKEISCFKEKSKDIFDIITHIDDEEHLWIVTNNHCNISGYRQRWLIHPYLRQPSFAKILQNCCFSNFTFGYPAKAVI